MAGGLNLYSYVQQDPINYIDPLGLAATDVYDGGSDTVPISIPGIGKPSGPAIVGGGIGLGIAFAIEQYINDDGTVDDSAGANDQCERKDKYKCEGYSNYDQKGTTKHVRRGSTWIVAYGKTKTIAAKRWKKKAQNAAPPGFTARHVKPRCKKVR